MKSETLIEKGYRNLKKAIISGEFCPGQSLPQRKTAERFGITTITAREIFRKLEHDGLIEIEPKWGASVTELGPEQIKGKYLVREALERMSARLIVENANKDDFNIGIAKASHCKEFIEELERINLQTLMWFNSLRADYTWHRENPKWH